MTRPTRYRYRAEILSIKRADKFKARIDLGFNVFKVLDLKLAGVSCPEFKDSPESIEFVKNLIAGHTVEIQTIRNLKGVWLCTLWVEGLHLNSALRKSEHGRDFIA